MGQPNNFAGQTPGSIGQKTTTIPVELSTRFLEHFSEQLYSSPQKAFEELISNGWDAGASHVDVRISPDLKSENATLCVLDNGTSMDEDGLRALWHIAFSPKQATPTLHGRPVIGKFGIGKLATYVLANQLTYICKAADGVIRRVTMDYSSIDLRKHAEKDSLISELKLDVFVATEAEVSAALLSVSDGQAILDLIADGFAAQEALQADDEFGAEQTPLKRTDSGTWTLVVLSDLKSPGRELRRGVLRRMLESALPFGSEMVITLDGQRLISSKSTLGTLAEWVIGPDLGINSIDLDEDGAPVDDEADEDAPSHTDSGAVGKKNAQKISISSGTSPVPYVELPGIGRVTGRVRLFENRISGSKSDERGASNGFHVNVLGRIVNQKDPSFGEENLSHAAWARFRMTVRADGLNDHLTTNREQFKERRELMVFRAFLRQVFNKARKSYDSDQNVMLPDGGDLLVRSLGVLSLSPLRNVVSDTLAGQAPLPGLFDEEGIGDREKKRDSWRNNTADNIRNTLRTVKYERIDDDSFVKFRLVDNAIVVNKDHPFVVEHSRTKVEKELLRDVALIDFLSDMYAIDAGIQPALLGRIRKYRDDLMRFRAMQQRRSGLYIAKLLLKMQHNSSNSRLLETVLSDALRYLGYQVRDLAKPGEPEGIASAYPLPTFSSPTRENPDPPLYSFTFDAKSSMHESAETGNIKLDTVVEHRKRYKAKYALVVAPGFTGNAIATRCGQQQVTPLTGQDLGKLLELTVEHGAIPITKLEEIFQVYDPSQVSAWVSELDEWLKRRRTLTLAVFLAALENLKGKVPDVLEAGTIAYECRRSLGEVSVKEADVMALARGLEILIPDLVAIDEHKITVNASATRVAAAVASQLERLHNDEPLESAEEGS